MSLHLESLEYIKHFFPTSQPQDLHPAGAKVSCLSVSPRIFLYKFYAKSNLLAATCTKAKNKQGRNAESQNPTETVEGCLAFSCAEFPKTLHRNLSSAPGLFLFHLFLASKRSTKTKQKLVKCLSQKGAVWAWLA